MRFEEWTAAQLVRAEAALEACLPAAGSLNAQLPQAMRYAVLGGGKRVRPLLVYGACEVVAGSAAAADAAAAALECIHAYSLVHDDMPCMDNDVLRRGKPTVHVQYGQATALLVGDALQALAFEVLTPTNGFAAALQAKLCAVLARAAGAAGMAGGQAIDLAFVGRPMLEAELKDMHARKTGALLIAAVEMGAACGQGAGLQEPAVLQKLSAYARAVGVAFQVVDDVLDCTADSATLGKTAGKDAASDKPTYVSVLGLNAAREYALELREDALDALKGLPHSERLAQLADFIVLRAS